ncbi:MAG: class I SAM-dependent methyltransferase [Bacillota bacterium]
MKNEMGKPAYGNWVPAEMIRKIGALLLIFCALDIALWIWLQGWFALKILLGLIAVFFLIVIVYFSRARWWFSSDGGDVQGKVLGVLLDHIKGNGGARALDIGCGSGALSIRLAKRYPGALVTGIDYWGGGWGFSQKQCEENARLEGVADRMEFRRGSASKLPFSDGRFDLVVSNLTFHEVRDSKNKLDAIAEALRVLKSGGEFVFQDLFLVKSYYGTTQELISAVARMGGEGVRFVDTSRSPFIPKVLKLPFMIGTLGLLCGKKR